MIREEVAQRLMNAAAKGLSAQSVLDEAFQITGLPISLLSPSIHKIAEAGMDLLVDEEFGRKDGGDLNKFKSWSSTVRTSTKPVIDENGGTQYRVMCFDVTAKGVQIGKLAMVEVRTFTEEDAHILELVSEVLTPILYFEGKESSNSLLRRTDFVKHLLNGEMTESEFQAAMMECDVKDDVLRRIILIQADASDETLLDIVLNKIQAELDALTTMTSKGVVVIVEDDNAVLEYIKQVLQVYGLHAGVSKNYRRLRDLNVYFQQAEVAMSFISDNKMTYYENIFLDDVIQSFLQKEYAVHSLRDEVKQLTLYDLQNGTQYVETLKKYIQSGCNMSEAAKALYLHYNTMKYRMNIIRNMIDFNELHMRDSIEILFSIYLFEYMKNK